MRDIKFRAWDVRHKSMTMITSLYFFEEEGVHEIVNGVAEGSNSTYQIMQYTGLKDTNGVEIYSGDIVDDNFVGRGEVKYNEAHAAFKIVYRNGRAKWFVDMLENESRIIEVIGNIYENPELLGE